MGENFCSFEIIFKTPKEAESFHKDMSNLLSLYGDDLKAAIDKIRLAEIRYSEKLAQLYNQHGDSLSISLIQIDGKYVTLQKTLGYYGASYYIPDYLDFLHSIGVQAAIATESVIEYGDVIYQLDENGNIAKQSKKLFEPMPITMKTPLNELYKCIGKTLQEVRVERIHCEDYIPVPLNGIFFKFSSWVSIGNTYSEPDSELDKEISISETSDWLAVVEKPVENELVNIIGKDLINIKAIFYEADFGEKVIASDNIRGLKFLFSDQEQLNVYHCNIEQRLEIYTEENKFPVFREVDLKDLL